MSDETILLHCPFCGSEAEVTETDGGWIVSCSSERNAGVSKGIKGYGATKAEAIAAWNIRAELWGVEK